MVNNICLQFQKIARDNAQATALANGGRTMNFSQLNRRANQVAFKVMMATKEGGSPIALLVGHDFAAVYGALGILKSGRAYSFLPPEYSVEKNQFILQDLHAELILTENAFADEALALAGSEMRVFNIERLGLDKEFPESDPPSTTDEESMAAVYYTSGSTGHPKGVIRTHGTILNRFQIDQSFYECGPGENVALLQSFHFAASAGNLFGGLLSGAAVHLAEIMQLGVTDLAQWLVEKRITRLGLLNTLLRQMVDVIPDDLVFSELRYCRPSGRTLVSDIERLSRHLPEECILAHGLASTETSLTIHLVLQRDSLPEGEIIPLGSPVSGATIELIDEEGAPVANGVAGEIVVTSASVSPGYWARPELTAQRFSQDPEDARRRTYRTGDLGRLRADNLVEYAGRRDSQVKIRGFRVELEAVEIALETLPGIAQAVALALPDGGGELQLVGYVEPRDGQSVSIPELRHLMSLQVPNYMVPARLVVMNRLPTGRTAKVNKNALPHPAQSRPELEADYIAPRSTTELVITLIWADVLAIGDIGVKDSFFDLGGQSLHAGMIAARVQDLFEVDISMVKVFESVTVEDLAVVVDEAMAHNPRTQEGGADSIVRKIIG